jgi:hypothetical protein
MKPEPGREPIHVMTKAGPVVLVPLAGGGHATLDAPDFAELKRIGLSTSFYLNGKDPHLYVKAGLWRTKGRGVGVARIVAGAGPGQVVKYRDKDRTNLRRRNLVLNSGCSKRDDAAIVAQDTLRKAREAQRPPQTTPKPAGVASLALP